MKSSLLENTRLRLARLTVGHLKLLNAFLDTFEQPISTTRLESSDFASPDFLSAFGDVLKLHHSLSQDYLDKHRFEAALVRVFTSLGITATRHKSLTHPGQDITVDQEKWSLKTQGDRGIRHDSLHISKFMELGKGRWDDESDLAGLRDQFLRHLRSYDRVFQLRYFRVIVEGAPLRHFYQLVEIPLTLLRKARRGVFRMMHNSQQIPKPGYCTVYDRRMAILFELYFDGGTERKLQIKDLRLDQCMVHATWEF